MIKFALVVDNEVACTIIIPDDMKDLDSMQRLAAALRSNFIAIETSNEDVKYGWTWDGTNFINPEV